MRKSGDFDPSDLDEIFQDAKAETTEAQDQNVEPDGSADADSKFTRLTIGIYLFN